MITIVCNGKLILLLYKFMDIQPCWIIKFQFSAHFGHSPNTPIFVVVDC